MNREKTINEVKSNAYFDVIIIGGGASGIGTAVDACLRGYRTLLLEKGDFTRGTSSRSTKLVHGGVRYLAQGDLKMVIEALRERGRLLRNAPHLVHNQSFIIPNYRWWEGMFYTIGLKLYDLLARNLSMGRSRHISRKKVLAMMPGIDPAGLKGGVLYHDGQFDDSRFAMELLHLLDENRGYALNYCSADNLLKNNEGKISGIIATDHVTNTVYEFRSKVVVNAAGVWVDEIMEMDQPDHEKSVRPSQGIHLVLPKSYLPGEQALMIPKTSDGRVLFAVPWHNHIVVGTTDTPLDITLEEPEALEEEIDFILKTASKYLKRKVTRSDVLSVFAGLRPLAAPKKNESKTREISRNHKILVSKSNMITVIGGKWTTYRRMAEDILETAISSGLLPPKECRTKNYRLSEDHLPDYGHLKMYGKRAVEIRELIKERPDLGEVLDTSLPYTRAELEWICKNEMVVHLGDILARRLRILFLDAKIAHAMAEKVADIAADQLGWDDHRKRQEISDFRNLAGKYMLNG